MLRIKGEFKRFLTEEKAQGATEYILILVAIVAVVVLFRTKITNYAGQMLDALQSEMGKALE